MSLLCTAVPVKNTQTRADDAFLQLSSFSAGRGPPANLRLASMMTSKIPLNTSSEIVNTSAAFAGHVTWFQCQAGAECGSNFADRSSGMPED